MKRPELKREYLYARDWPNRIAYAQYCVWVLQRYAHIQELSIQTAATKTDLIMASVPEIMTRSNINDLNMRPINEALCLFYNWAGTGYTHKPRVKEVLDELDILIDSLQPAYNWMVANSRMDKRTGIGAPLIFIAPVNARDILRFMQDIEEQQPDRLKEIRADLEYKLVSSALKERTHKAVSALMKASL